MDGVGWLYQFAYRRVLFGPPAHSFVPRITRAMLNQALARGQWRDVPSYRDYAVLTLCRILYSLNTGAVVSKPRAARWALRSIPASYRAIIRQAMQHEEKKSRRRISLRQIRSLLQYVRFAMNPAV